jgi:Mn2+/Fe2+ NRAMP family transporter
LNVLTGWTFETGAWVSCLFALVLFWSREIGSMLDGFTKVLGVVKIALALFIAFAANPPVMEAVRHTFVPEKLSIAAIITIVGGTVGGYLTFSGAHRLLDAGISGVENLREVDKSASRGIMISSMMRFILFLAVVGVVSSGITLDRNNPAATVFESAAGKTGLRLFGIILWSAAISSVVGAAYTSVSFFKTFHPSILKYERWWISGFIIISTLIFVAIGKPKELLLMAGAVNGLILPVALAVILIAAGKAHLMKGYRHPAWMVFSGWIVVAIMGWMGAAAILEWVTG